jgi:hypothetical protein
MKRREFIALLVGAATISPLATNAQQRIRRVAVLSVGVIVHELAKLGYIDGKNISYDMSGAEGDSSRLPQLALELVAKKPDVLVGSSSKVAVALANATREIPIVMLVVGDPIALGLSDSMAHPSRNVTGFTMSTDKEWEGVPATGRKAKWTVIIIGRFKGHKLAEDWVEYHRYNLFRQLGRTERSGRECLLLTQSGQHGRQIN